MPSLHFDVFDHEPRTVDVSHVFNAGYAGRNTAEVQAHVDELAQLGVPAPSRVPTLYPLSSNLAVQSAHLQVPHGHTSGEAEWALVVTQDGVLLTAACDHTDRDLEVHGVAASKQSAPDVLATAAWLLSDVEADLDSFTLKGWVGHAGQETLIQDGTLGQLLSPGYWLEQMGAKGLIAPGVMVMSGTFPMAAGVDQFGDRWRVEMTDPRGRSASLCYDVEQLVEPWQ